MVHHGQMGSAMDPFFHDDDRRDILHLLHVRTLRYELRIQWREPKEAFFQFLKGLFRFRQPYALLGNISNPLIFVDSNPWITVTLAMIGKFQIAASFAVIYVYAGELMPTVVRSEAMGISSFVAGIGLLLFPYINALVRKTWKRKIILESFSNFSSIHLWSYW